jgi:Protein of unknown function (DUF3618)
MTSGQPGKSPGRKSPGQRAAEAAIVPDGGPPADTAGAGDAAETARQADAEAAAPDDVEELKQQIEQHRDQLGETVEQLAAKADVKSRARAKVAALSGRVKSTTGQARKQAAARAGSMRSQFASQTAATRQKAVSVSGTGKNQLQTRAAAVGAPVWEATPEQVRRAVARRASTARQHRLPLAVAAGALILGYLAIRQWRKR